MAKTVTFEDPHGIGAPITLQKAVIPSDLPDAEIRRDHIPEPDPCLLYTSPSPRD